MMPMQFVRPCLRDDFVDPNSASVRFLFEKAKLKRWPQVVAFYGATGCGKTSRALWIAAQNSCPDRGPQRLPCGTCKACERILYGCRLHGLYYGEWAHLLNLYSFDMAKPKAASDFVSYYARDDHALLHDSIASKGAHYKLSDRQRVYLLDEVHALSPKKQHQLLVAIERAMIKCMVVICTTDYDALIPALKNRIGAYAIEVKDPTRDQMVDFIHRQVKQRGGSIDDACADWVVDAHGMDVRRVVSQLDALLQIDPHIDRSVWLREFEEPRKDLLDDSTDPRF